MRLKEAGGFVRNAAIALLLGLTVIVLPARVEAVMVSPNGSGEALILPYFTVNAGNNSIMSVFNERALPQAVKVIVRNEFGEAVLSFNLYLEPYGSCAFAHPLP
ncbi:MAG: hypothetical protein AAGH19_06045 [Pseudomonadota bacterium]